MRVFLGHEKVADIMPHCREKRQKETLSDLIVSRTSTQRNGSLAWHSGCLQSGTHLPLLCYSLGLVFRCPVFFVRDISFLTMMSPLKMECPPTHIASHVWTFNIYKVSLKWHMKIACDSSVWR
jgi:hypothetical protein